MNAGPSCTNMPMKTCLLVLGLLVLKSSTLMNEICAVGLHQVMFYFQEGFNWRHPYPNTEMMESYEL